MFFLPLQTQAIGLLSYDRGLLRFQRCFRHIHRQFYTQGDSHANTRSQAHIRTLSEEIIIHYPFKKKNIFISLQWHVLCKMSLQQRI